MDTASALNRWYRCPRPVTTLQLSLRRPDAGAGRDDLALRWRGLRRALADQRVDATRLARLDGAVEALQPSPRSVCLLTDGAELATFDVDGDDDRAWPGPLPAGIAVLHRLQRRVPYLLALVDRTGGELRGFDREGHELMAERLVGPDDEIERNAPGGWAQRRYQHRAEDSWQHNAAAVARALATASARLRPALVAVAGDVRAMQLLRAQASEALAPLLVPLERGGGPSPDGSEPLRAAAVESAVAATARREVAAARDRLAEALGTGAAVVGAPATAELLCRGAAATLFVPDDPDDRRRGCYGEGAGAVATEPGPATPRSARLVDALVRAALSTEATVVVLERGDPPGDVAAIRRF